MKDGKVNPTEKKAEKINYFMLFLLTLLIGVGSCALLGWSYFNKTVEIRDLKRGEILIQAKVEKANGEITTTKKELEVCHGELSKLRERMAGIKNTDDLLRRDIFLYIDKKFQIIPRTVAIDTAEQVVKLSKQYDVSAELVVGIMQVESGFNPMAISKANARGLMQVMPEWAKKFNLKKVSDLHDIDIGIESGIKVLKIHIDEGKGNISKGLYYYVGKDSTYAGKVYEAMGKFVAFRSTVDDDQPDDDPNGNGKEKEKGKDAKTKH